MSAVIHLLPQKHEILTHLYFHMSRNDAKGDSGKCDCFIGLHKIIVDKLKWHKHSEGNDMIASFLSTLFVIYNLLLCFLTISMELRRKEEKPRSVLLEKAYLSGIKFHLFSTCFALLVAGSNRIWVFGANLLDGKLVLLGIGFLILNSGLELLEWRFTPEKYKKRTANFLPRTIKQRLIWVVYSMETGVGEEIIFRSVLFGIFFQLTGNYWIASSISAVIFAIAHAGKGLLAIVSVFFVGMVLQWFVRISGGLYLAISVHFIHNLINGIIGGILIKPRTAGEPARDEAISATTDILSPVSPSPAQTDVTES